MKNTEIGTVHKRLLENIMALEELKAKGEDKDTITDIQWFLVDLATLLVAAHIILIRILRRE